MRLQVKMKNAKECRIELPFPDLSVKYNNGYAPSLKVKEGDEIPLDVLDPEDVRKSLKVGSLKGYLENGWIEEILEEPKAEDKIILSKTNSINELDIKVEQKQLDVPTTTILPEVAKVDSIKMVENKQITDLNKVFSYEDFCKLDHFLKIRFIKESQNIDLLKDILGKTTSNQFKNNIELRLSQIK